MILSPIDGDPTARKSKKSKTASRNSQKLRSLPFKTQLNHPELDKARASRKIDGRFHPITKDKTPSLKDSDIKELISKYPVKHHQVNADELGEGAKIDYSLGLKSVVNAINAIENKDKPKDDESQKDEGDQKKVPGTKVIKQCLETLTRNIDRIRKEEKENQKDFMVTLVQNEIRNIELNKMMDLMKEVDFAEGE